MNNDMFIINGCSLDEYQVNAIKSTNKSTLLVAGAGAGKTLTILGKIKYLIEVLGYKEEDILCISFTNETCNSLSNKLTNLGYNIDVKTFHKLGLSILRSNEIHIASNDYLTYIINEYFNSYVKDSKKHMKYLIQYLKYIGNINNLFKSKEYYNLVHLINTFINLANGNNYDIKYIYKLYKYSFFDNRYILKFILDIFIIYNNELTSCGLIDFNMMINNAIKEVKNKEIPYKYIIIDEFQDTSLNKYLLIKEIINKNNANVFVVGDDWQSIYRFSGCNLDLFINFTNYFDDAKIYYLKYTYRNSQELINVSAKFIMENKQQLKKEIKSNKYINRPIKLVYNKSLDYIKSLIDDDYLILGRNNFDIKNIEDNNKLTIHRSKGLEAKNIILVNSHTIPNKIKNEYILKYVQESKDYILYEEERRLFYVALTRAKDNIYIMVNNTNVSPFITELLKNYKDYIEIIK